MPEDYLLGRVLAKNIIDPDTGEVIANANDELTETVLENLREAGVKQIQTLYTNDLTRVRTFRRPCVRTTRPTRPRRASPSTA